MSVAVVEAPHVLHAIAGRIRVQIPGWSGGGKQSIEEKLRQLPGILSVQANSLTSNVLVTFDPATQNEQTIINAISWLDLAQLNELPKKEVSPPRAHREKEGNP